MTVDTDLMAGPRSGASSTAAIGGEAPQPRESNSGSATRRWWPAYLVAGGGYLLLSLFAWSNAWTSHPTSVTTCGCGDSSLFTWYLEWPAYAMAHGLNPFFSTAMNYPTGVNLLTNTSELAFGVVLAPVTWLVGPVATLNVALTLSPVLSALAMFALLRRWVAWTPAAFIGGLFYGFSSFVIASLADAHLMLGMVAVPPLVVACLDELLIRQRHSPVRIGILLGLLVTLQFFIGTEVLLMMAIMGVVGIAFVAAYAAHRYPEVLRAHTRRAWTGLLAGGVTAGVLLAYPAWFAIAGPAHLSGAIWPGQILQQGETLKDYLVPNQHMVGPAVSYSADHLIGGYQGFLLSYQYFGVGVLAVVVVGCLVWRRDRRLWLFGALTLSSVVLSLGSNRAVFLPWEVVANLPLFENVVPYRFVLFAYLGVAVMLGLIVDHSYVAVNRRSESARAGRQRGPEGGGRSRSSQWPGAVAGIVVAAIALVPPALYIAQALPYTTPPIALPTWFRTVAPHLPPHQVLLIFPTPFTAYDNPMTWQAVNRMHYSMAEQGGPAGSLSRAGKETAGAVALANASTSFLQGPSLRSATSAGDLESVRKALSDWGVTMVVLPDQPDLPTYDQIPSVTYAAALITAATGKLPIHLADAWVWSGVGGTSPTAVPTSVRFSMCTQGAASRGVSGVEAATRCVLEAPTG